MLDNFTRWWELDETEQYMSVFSLIKRIDTEDLNRRETNLRCARLYGNNIFASLTPNGYFTRYVNNITNQKRMTLNVICNMADTVNSKMTKIKPKVAFLTQNGDYALQMKAKKLQKFVEGQFYLNKYYDMTNKRVLDSLIFDVGITKIAANGAEIIVERVFPDEIKVDPEDAAYGTPSHLYQIKYYRRSVLLQMFPEKKTEIEQAASHFNNEYRNTWQDVSNDFVCVIEGWHKKSGPKAKDGMHIIAISTCTLQVKKWDKKNFPFIFTRWADGIIGFFGQSLADRLTSIQFEINKILRDIQTSMNLFAIPFIALEVGSRINRAQLNNQIAHIVDYVNQAPRFETPPAMNQQVFDHLERLIKQAYEIAGISQLSATSRKPSGLDAAVALREYQDIESERFLTFGSRVEQSYMESAELFIEAAKDASEYNKDLKVNVRGKKFIETIKWADIDLDEEAYEMKLYAASLLPESPAGRLQVVMEMAQAGMIDKEEQMSLLEYPDLESYTSLLTASVEDIQYVISKMLEDGEYQAPEPAQDLKRGIKMVGAAYLRAKNSDVDLNKLSLLQQWIEDASELIGQTVQAPPPPEGGAGMPGLLPGMGAPPMPGAPSAPPVPGAPQVGLPTPLMLPTGV